MSSASQARISFTILLVVLAAVLLLLPFFVVGGTGHLWLRLLSIVAMLSALWKLQPGRRVIGLAVTVVIVNVGVVGARLYSSAEGWVAIEHATGAAFLLLVAGSITGNVWREREVSADTIVGGIAVYLLIGAIFSIAFQLLESLAPGSFAITFNGPGHWGPWEASPGHFPRLLFFSFVTLTTLGYGDIVPASPQAAGLSAVAAIVGPLYLTVLIARLVGLHVAGSRSGGNGPGAGDSPQPG